MLAHARTRSWGSVCVIRMRETRGCLNRRTRTRGLGLSEEMQEQDLVTNDRGWGCLKRGGYVGDGSGEVAGLGLKISLALVHHRRARLPGHCRR
jgi:hypothetical protein